MHGRDRPPAPEPSPEATCIDRLKQTHHGRQEARNLPHYPAFILMQPSHVGPVQRDESAPLAERIRTAQGMTANHGWGDT